MKSIMHATIRRGFWVGVLALGLGTAAQAANPPPSQVYYIPFPENDQLAAYQSITNGAASPMAEFITFSTASDNTVIYYDHWEDGYEADITNPIQATTEVYGDGVPGNGFPSGNPGDLIPAGTVFSLRNFVNTSTLQAVLDYDARDKVASYKALSLTKVTYPQNIASLLAGCYEIYERGIWGTEYRSPVGVNLATSVDADMFSRTVLSVMAGEQGANVQIDADNNGTFEQTAALAEGGTSYVTNVVVGARVLSDNPVQVVLFAGRPSSRSVTGYMGRDTSLMPTTRWSSNYYCPVSTPATASGFPCSTVVFLYNPGASQITVTYAYRSSNTAYTTATINVPAGQTVKTPALLDNEAYRFYTTDGALFYAFCTVDGGSTDVSDNAVWDGGFALIGQTSLTTQLLLSLGVGRDPYSTTNPTQNANPVYVTTVGNGNTLATVYVDYDGDNAGANTDPNGNKYDVSYSVRELDQLQLLDPDGDQSGMLVYTLDANVKLAGAWAQDPSTASAAQPGFDVATAIPPLREGDAGKSSTLAVDADGDGYKSAGDTLTYDIRVINTARTPIPGPFTVTDNLPADTTYVPNSTRYRVSVAGAWTAWVAVPDDGSGTAFPLDGAGYPLPGTLGFGQQIQLEFSAQVDTYPNLDPGRDRIRNTGSVEVSPYGTVIPLDWTDLLYGSIGDRVWIDTDGDALQDPGETGLNGVVVYADLNNNGARDTGEPTQTTSGDGAYVLNGLRAGTYTIRVDPASVAALNPGYGPTYDLDGIATAYVASVPLLAAQDRTDADFGFRIGASLGDFVWLDRDGDGVQDAGEPGINGVRVYIDLDNDNAYDAGEPNTITSGDGAYIIGNLSAGTYAVRVDTTTLPTGATQTFDRTAPTNDHEASVTLIGSEFVNDVDFGYRGALSIGDRVWEDLDGDGVQDAGEGGLTGVRVYIDSNGNGAFDTTEASAVTGTNGAYTIGNLFNGTYTVRVDPSTLPGSVVQTYDLTAPTNDNTATVVLSGASRTDVDFGYRNDATLGDFVWNDLDHDTNQDPGEPGLAGIRVYIDANSNGILDVGERFTETDLAGYYLFDNLAAGTYRVQLDFGTIPAGSIATVDLDGTNTVNRANRTLTTSEDATNVDFGYYTPSSLGDRVWNDLDGDGAQDAGEPGLTNVVVFVDMNGNGIFDSATEPSDTTDNTGAYAITGLVAGTYTVRVVPPPGYTQTYDLTGALDNTASAGLTAGQTRTDVDFGYVLPATLGDRVWVDLDGDGVQDTGEPGLDGVTVTLHRASDNGIVGTTTTSGGGAYQFTNLAPGAYYAVFGSLAGYGRSPADQGGNDALDSDANASTGRTPDVTLSGGQTLLTLDAGYLPPGAIGSRVWLDENSDGYQDAGEPGLPNVQVNLYNAAGALVASTVTDTQGGYLFANVAPGSYYVDVLDGTGNQAYTLPVAGMTQTPPSTRPNLDLGNQDHGATSIPGGGGLTGYPLTVTPGGENLTADFGYNHNPSPDVNTNTGAGAIGDRVWVDADGDGKQDPGEPGLGGVTVTLTSPGADGVFGNGDDPAPVVTTTSVTGSYLFDGLSAGVYSVTVTAPANYTQTGDPDHFGATGTNDNKTTAPISLAPGDVYVNADFGYQPDAGIGASIGDLVWLDLDGNGAQNGSEPGISGVTVALIRDTNGNGVRDAGEPVIATTLTGASGAYLFTGVPVADGAGTDDYLVWVNDTGGVLTGLTPSYDANGTGTPNLSAATNLDATGNLLQDFGYRPKDSTPGDAGTGVIGDTIFLDRDSSGAPGAGEGLEGVTVGLYDAAGTTLIARTVTDENGLYFFRGLADATYTVKVDTTTLPGTGLANTADPDGGNNSQSSVVISGGNVNLLQDFGYRASTPNTIGGTIWEDRNADGTLVSGETQRFAGVTVALLDSRGNLVGTAVTDAGGTYSFNGLPNDTYTVDVTDTAGVLVGKWHSLGPSAGADNNSQTDPYSVTVSGGQTNTTADFGYWLDGGALGNRIWWDADGDGIQDTGETGLSGATVRLTIVYANNTTNRWTVTSAADGSYQFPNLLSDEDYLGGSGAGEPTYILSVAPLATYNYSPRDMGGNDSLDSDRGTGVLAIALRGVTDVAPLANPANESAPGWYDFGFTKIPTAAVITRVTAQSIGGVTVVEWEVGLELDTVGFHLERLTDTGWERINPALLASNPFEPAPKTYRQTDPGAAPRGTYTWRILELDGQGRLLAYGPYELTVDGAAISYESWASGVAWNGAADTQDADPDGDGLTNFEEYIAGMDPLDADSVLAITRIVPQAGGFQLSWPSAPDRTYTVEISVAPGNGYLPVVTGIAATPPENTILCPVDPKAVPRAFFRIIAKP